MMLRRFALAVTLSLSGAAFAAATPDKPMFGRFGIDTTANDPTIAPGDDFPSYVNGKWYATATIPADRSWYSESLRINDDTMLRVRAIDEAAGSSPKSDSERKVGDYYASYLDEAAIEAKGKSPLSPELALVAAVNNPRELAATMARLERSMAPATFGQPQSAFPIAPGVGPDLKDPSRHISGFDQGGLGLPDKSYYTSTDPDIVKMRSAYRDYAIAMFHLAGWTDDPARVDRVITLEGRIAASQWDRAATRDVAKTYNLMTLPQLEAAAPGFDWATYLKEAKLGGRSNYVVSEPSAMAGFAKLVPNTPIETWRDYLALRVIGNAAPMLSKAFVDADFAYHGKALSGTPQLRARWKRAVAFTNVALGDAVGKVYAAQYFPASSKAAMLTMVDQLRTAMAARIDRLDWMAPQTKLRAEKKLANLLIQVGYPDHWREYSGFTVVRGDAYGNYVRAAQFEYDRWIGKLDKPVDRGEWSITATPQTVNAFNAGAQVKLIFPAAFLAPPHFDPNADPAVNYGSIGAVIGHEITHSFDDQGAKLDENGRLSDWWTPADVKAFEAATGKLAAEFDAYVPAPGMHINGRLTLGETTADLGGLLVALDAYHASLGGKPAPILGGLTGDQRFFMSFAQTWRELQRPEDLRDQVTNDPHPPGRYRAMTVRNVDAWYAAFGIKSGKMALAPADRVKIW
ncbi:M13 family metallopeptidase [Sphingomonas panacisoli]|uniref:M13 family metallopeptidase n=2 Tax=Sphingomonas panacisoli TaxID=1813879 RepID=A0A5B8LF89_9SPHN|nr:M13 family metallopeptidase [Sphingomonas panacisoli]